jgi:hypothetical protein
MPEPYFPELAVEALREAKYDPDAQPSYGIFSGAYMWADENYNEFVGACLNSDNKRYFEPIRYRASVILGEPPTDTDRRGWEELRRMCPEWPGFHPSRYGEHWRESLKAEREEGWGPTSPKRPWWKFWSKA